MPTAITTATLNPTTRQQPDSPRVLQRKRQMRKSGVKSSHKGLLHKDADKPQGEKFTVAELEELKRSKNPVTRKR